MEGPTPISEVIESIIRDWKENGITVEDAARQLGLKNRQTIYNLFHTCRTSNQYFTRPLSVKWARAFGYNKDYLTDGAGPLKLQLSDNELLKEESYGYRHLKERALFDIASAIIANSSDSLAQEAWEAIMNKQLDVYQDRMKQMVVRKTGKFFPGQDLYFAALIACVNSAKEIVDHGMAMDEMQRHDYLGWMNKTYEPKE